MSRTRLVTAVVVGLMFVCGWSATARAQVDVALCGADSAAYLLDVETKLMATGNITSVTNLNCSTSTPTLATLQLYDAVMTWGDATFDDNVTLGNNLADYVDGGGGVVDAMWGNADGVGSAALAGRFDTDDYGGFTVQSWASAVGPTLVQDDPTHPIFTGVTGVTFGFSATASTLHANGTLIGSLSNGNRLAAVRNDHNGRVVSLGFWPISSDEHGSGWSSATDGALLMANALVWAATAGIDVALCGADSAAYLLDVETKILAQPGINSVTNLDCAISTPTLATLQTFDAVMTWGDATFDDNVTLGNNLADYVDSGGGVVDAMWGNADGVGSAALAGRFDTSDYGGLSVQSWASAVGPTLVQDDPTHPIFVGVTGVTFGFSATASTLHANGTLIGSLSNGNRLAAVRNDHNGRVVSLAFWPISSDQHGSGWTASTDGDVLMANALKWVGGSTSGAVCGNGVTEGSEACDDGNANNNDDCLDTCEAAACGDGFLHNQGTGTETCDDGNSVNNDDCLNTCAVAACGDGVTHNQGAGTEACDDGNANNNDDCLDTCVAASCGDGVTHNQGTGTEACDDANANNNDDCLDTCVAASCGDGILHNQGTGTETCDDGNSVNNDDCLNTCAVASCGDGVTHNQGTGTEACDDGNANNNDDCLDTCVAASCGDGITHNQGTGTETCDDANAVNNDDCLNTCVAASCGDGILHDQGTGTEACDDGNAIDNDDCLNTCVVASCGDGVMHDQGTGTEACDDGNAIDNDDCLNTCVVASCGDGVTHDQGTGTEACDDGNAVDNDDCLNTCEAASCGDGVIHNAGTGTEECDDGAGNSDVTPDACRTTCAAAACGDAVADTGEECDDGNADDTDDCLNACTDATCGDGVTHAIDEECDDGNTVDDDACSNACVQNECGDGTVDPGEECDDGVANSDTYPDACRADCSNPSCGDGVIDTMETCDDGAANNDTAADGCRTNCAVASCGDGVVDTGEECDEGAANADGGSCSTTCTIVEGAGNSGGCGCEASGSPTDGRFLLLLLIGAFLIRRRRRNKNK